MDGKLEHTRLLVLSLLSREDLYGYQMIMELELRSDHTFSMKEGTLYPILHGMEKDGMVEAYFAEPSAGRKRKYYHLTEKGRKQLTRETEEWRTYAGAVNAVLENTMAMA